LNNTPYSAALITGAGHRIGRAIALSLGAKGYAVAVHYHGSAKAAEAVVSEITSAGGRATPVSADLLVESDVRNLVSSASRALGMPIDILVNNASIFEQDTLATFTYDSWDRHQKVNLLAPLLLMQCLAESVAAGANAAVINIIDQRVLKLNPQYMSYTLAKSGLWTATRTAAQALAPSIRINAIGPGPTLSNSTQSKQDFANEAAAVPLGIGPTLEEITRAINFILESPAMTGQMITLDGGQHLAWRTADILED
jgi:NAD(P)-dependent dehydrogenase (short-subunit alcohol dehydrogenase family)